jgi:hypothetical protein
MALATDPTYSTYVQFQTYTPVASQKDVSFTEDIWKPYAILAEKILDSFVLIPDFLKYSQDQDLKFPIKDKDGNALIPDDVVLAHILITSDLALKGDMQASTDLIETSESWDSSGYSVNKSQKSTISSSEDIKVIIPPLAKKLLLPWSNKTARLNY